MWHGAIFSVHNTLPGRVKESFVLLVKYVHFRHFFVLEADNEMDIAEQNNSETISWGIRISESVRISV